MAQASRTSESDTSTDSPKFVERDALDHGVPMLAGSPDEPTGPEDALGEGPTRGDYSNRVGPSNYQPHQVVSAGRREDGTIVPDVQDQRTFVEQGEVEGKKGGVDSASK